MKHLVMICAVALFGFINFAHAEETLSEKAKATANDVKRSAKKGAHRVEEAMCAEGDAKCLKKKAENRVKEGSDYVKDKAEETKNAIDSK